MCISYIFDQSQLGIDYFQALRKKSWRAEPRFELKTSQSQSEHALHLTTDPPPSSLLKHTLITEPVYLQPLSLKKPLRTNEAQPLTIFRTCVLERRHLVGGAAVTEEIVPGYKFSRASYLLSLLRPRIFNDLELRRHGLKIYLRDPSSYTPLLPEFQTSGGPTSLTLGMDHGKNCAELRKFSVRDAERFGAYEEQLRLFVEAVDPLLDQSPPNIAQLNGSVLQKLKAWPQVIM